MIALVTGSARGIGAATAYRLAEDGFDVAINGLTDDEINGSGSELKAKIEALGVRAELYRADVSKYDECADMFDKIKADFGRLDVLVNNAGITRDGLIARMSEENYDAVIAVNQKSAFNTIKLASAIMIKQRSGRIVNVASVAGLYGNAGQFNYSASKAAIIGMTKAAAKELGARGITVNAVAPGFIETPMTDKLTDEQKSAILGGISLKRYGKPSEVAALISFLCGKDSEYITGQVIEISGGIVM